MEAIDFIFKRYSPENKRKFINEMTEKELLRVNKAIILRIIKEAGRGDSRKTRSKFKTLSLREYNVGNDWNSTVETVFNEKKDEVYLDVYIQGNDTDFTIECSLNDFFNKRCVGYFEESYLHSSPQRINANYDEVDKARVIKTILLSYIDNNYK